MTKKILKKARFIKTARSWEERLAGLKGVDRDTYPIVYTRLNKKEYESRRDSFDEYAPNHLSSMTYDEWVELGAQGGRPLKWTSEANRKRFERAQKKLELERSLNDREREVLGLIKRRPQAYKSELGRPMTAAERKRKQRQKNKTL